MFKTFKYSTLLFIALLLQSVMSIKGQKYSADSLEAILKRSAHDSVRCKIINNFVTNEVNDLLKEKYIERCNKICINNLSRKNISEKEKKLFIGLFAANLSNQAQQFFEKGNINKSLELMHQSLKLREEINDLPGIANAYNNIGVIYIELEDTKNGIEYLERSLKIVKALNDNALAGALLGNIGIIYRNKSDFKNALKNLNEGLEILRELHDSSEIAYVLASIGGTYNFMDEREKAIKYYTESLMIQQLIRDADGEAGTLTTIGMTYFRAKEYKNAIVYLEKSLKLSTAIGHVKKIEVASKHLYNSYKQIHNYKNALNCFELFIKMRDSINNESTRKASIKSQLKYEYEKQAAADSVGHAKESEIKNVELEKQKVEIKAKKNQQYALFGGLALVIIFAGFMYNRFKITQKQKSIIEQQKEVVEEQKKIVEEKQKEVLDSIHYAKRIQTAHLPNEKTINKNIQRLMKS